MKNDAPLGLPLKPDRRTLWLIIPVLMAIILILNLTAPKADQAPTQALNARWINTSSDSWVSLITPQPEIWQKYLREQYPQLIVEQRDSEHFTAVRVRGSTEWLLQSWPASAQALAVAGDLTLQQWEHSIGQLTPDAAESPRQDPNFILQRLAARLADSPDSRAQFDAQKRRLMEQLTDAMNTPNARQSLLETMAFENLPIDWHTQQAERLKILTYAELAPWLNP